MRLASPRLWLAIAVHSPATRASLSSPFVIVAREILHADNFETHVCSTGKFWLTFDEEILPMMTLVSRLARLHHHFFLDFIFQ